jgi:broad specificity phosphatase PhoE
MSFIRYITHPEVAIRASIPVPEWQLSERGVARTIAMLQQPWIASVQRILTSHETKAKQAGQIVADHLGLHVEVCAHTGETDRSSTGFVPHDRHEELANEFFANPTKRAQGWERAIDVQTRITKAFDHLFTAPLAGTLIVGHGAAGTLWYCALNSFEINRAYDQPASGQYFTVDALSRKTLHPWKPIDDIEA